MTIDVDALSAPLEAPSLEIWRRLAQGAIGTADFGAALVRRTADDLARGPLFTGDDAAHPRFSVRAEQPLWLAPRPWDIRVRIDTPDPARANADALSALEGGASSLELAIDPSGRDGVMVANLDDLRAVLAEVRLDLAPISLDAGPLAPQAAAILSALSQERGPAPKALPCAFNLDPLGDVARWPDLGADVDAALDDACGWAIHAAGDAGATVFRADGRRIHEAGGSEALEIAWAAACAWDYVTAMDDRGLSPGQGFARIRLALAADVDVHLTIAKLRAMRLVWSRLVIAANLDPNAAPAWIDAFGARRMLSALDPWTNLVRLAAAGFAAATAGADAIVLPAFTAPLGRPTPFAERVSRNLHHLLALESGVGRVEDPAAGSYLHEALSEGLTRAAWAIVQDIEAAGGSARFVTSGRLFERVAAGRAALEADVTRRKTPIIGVSEHAQLDARHPEVETLDLDALTETAQRRRAARPRASSAPPKRATPEALIPLALDGCDLEALTVTRMGAAEPQSHITPTHAPLSPFRVSEPFEALRRVADSTLSRPVVYLAALGAPASASARLDFIRRLAAVGGLEAREGGADPDAWRAAGAPKLAILCGADASYAQTGAAAARDLVAAGAEVWVAGGPAAIEAALRAEGAGRVVRAGDDMIEHLKAAQAALGLGGGDDDR